LRKQLGIVLAMVAMVAVMLPGAASAAPGGNSGNAKLCESYTTLQRSDGTLFADKGECVSYGAQGGQIDPISQVQPSVSMSWFANQFNPDHCEPRIGLAGFAPDTAYSVHIERDNNGSIYELVSPIPMTTDSAGEASYGFCCWQKGLLLRAVVGVIKSDFDTVTC
jgi:hypothetical protein